MVLQFQPLLKVLDFLPQSLFRHYALDSLAVVELNLQGGASELIRGNKQNPHGSLDIPKECVLIEREVLSEGKSESLEAGSILPFWVLLLLFAFAHSKNGFSRGPRNQMSLRLY